MTRLTGAFLGSLALLALSGTAPAQAPGKPSASPTVSWTSSPIALPRNARRAVLNVRGTIREGWHVYALKQTATGPTPLLISVEKNDIALADGAPSGDRPVAAFEPAFGSITPYYVRSVSLNIPVRLRAGLVAGRQSVPVKLRYQACDGRTCEPPKTVQLNAPVDIQAGS